MDLGTAFSCLYQSVIYGRERGGGGGGCEACAGSEAAMIKIEHCDHAKDKQSFLPLLKLS